MTTHTRRIIKADGTEVPLPNALGTEEIARLIGANVMSAVLIKPERAFVMLVDDCGHATGKPVNDKATQIYLAQCKPGTVWQIRGDVAIVPDNDFA